MRTLFLCNALPAHGVGFLCNHRGVTTTRVCLDNPVGVFAARYNRKQLVVHHFSMQILLLDLECKVHKLLPKPPVSVGSPAGQRLVELDLFRGVEKASCMDSG